MIEMNNNKSVAWEPLVYNPTISKLDQRVFRYKNAIESDSFFTRLIARVVVIVRAIFYILGIITIRLIPQFLARLHHKRELDAFKESVKTKQPPPIPGNIEVNTKTQGLNHVSSFVIHEGIIWTKRILNDYGQPDKDAVWEPIYFDGWPNVDPVEIKLDGANLIVIDNKNGVHYKKVIKEHYQDVEQFYKNIPDDEQPSNKAKEQSVKNDFWEFTIFNNKVWHRRIDDFEPTWRPVYIPLNYDFYGTPKLSLKELKIEKNELVAIDNRNGEHKVSRDNYERKKNYYTIHVKSDKDNWKDRWFTLPYLNKIVNVFTGNRLYLPEFTKAWAVGHRGQFNHYIQDRDMYKHAVGAGVTNLYILEKKGNFIYLFDPWKPQNVQVKIPVPGTVDCPFVAEYISVAANMILVTGYKYEKQNDGRVIKKPAAYIMIADVDSLGWNPTINYTFFSEDHEKNPLMRILPTVPGWEEIALPEGEISSDCTILQTGEGNDNREMRFMGKKDDLEGYWHKGLKEDSWNFTEMAFPDPEEYKNKVMNVDENPIEVPFPKIFNWKSGDISLNNFNNGSIVGTLRVGKVDLLLHRKENIILKILLQGKKLHRYDLVLPEGANKDELPLEFQNFFKNSRVVRVKIKKIEKEKEKELGRKEGRKLWIKETTDPRRIGQGLPGKKLEIVLNRTDIETE